jgi:hypothetical protein
MLLVAVKEYSKRAGIPRLISSIFMDYKGYALSEAL